MPHPKLTALSLLLAGLLLISGCNEKAPANSLDTQTTAADGEITLLGAPLSDYSIVRSDSADSGVVEISKAMRDALLNGCGAKLALATDWVDKKGGSEKPSRAILIGETNYPESEGIADNLKVNDYVLRAAGSCLAVAAGSAEAYSSAISYLTDYLASVKGIADGYSYEYRGEYAVSELNFGTKKLAGVSVTANKIDMAAAEKLAAGISEKAGLPASAKGEYSSADIVIQRPEPYNQPSYSGYDYFGYTVEYKDGRVFITGGGDSALIAAVDDFLAHLNGGNVTIDNGFKLTGSAESEISGSIRGLSANELVAEMGIGINLGNTFDAYSDDPASKAAASLDSETLWYSPRITRDMIGDLREAGFTTLRIPVTWYRHLDGDGNIDIKWLGRVQEIVNYALDAGFHVIINTHHEDDWLKTSEENYAAKEKKFLRIWTQVAARFRNYGDYLAFEGLNEPRVKGGKDEWSGGTEENRAVLNRLNAAFIKAVRDDGGNNAGRLLIIPTLAASAADIAMNSLEIPDRNTAVSVHAYMPYSFAMDEKGETTFTDSAKKTIDSTLDRILTAFVSKGTPVIMGEFGTLTIKPEAEVAKWAEYYVTSAYKRGIMCIWWDDNGGFKLYNRASREWIRPEVNKALFSAYEGK